MTSFNLEIVTPNGQPYNGPAEKVLVRTVHGDITILARHIDYVSALGMGECRVTLEGGQVRRALCSGGMVVVSGGNVRVISGTFEWAEEINIDHAQRHTAIAEKALATNLSETDRRAMEVKLRKNQLRLKIHGEN